MTLTDLFRRTTCTVRIWLYVLLYTSSIAILVQHAQCRGHSGDGELWICRWSAVIKDGKFASFNVEPDGGGSRTSISSSGNTLEQLQSL